MNTIHPDDLLTQIYGIVHGYSKVTHATSDSPYLVDIPIGYAEHRYKINGRHIMHDWFWIRYTSTHPPCPDPDSDNIGWITTIK